MGIKEIDRNLGSADLALTSSVGKNTNLNSLKHLRKISNSSGISTILRPVKLLIYHIFRREIEDLRSYRHAAEVEIQDLKNQTLLYKDEVNYLREYLHTSLKNIDLLTKPQSAVENKLQVLDEQRQWRAFNLRPPDRSKEYASCKWIEGGLSFVPGQIKVCPNCIKCGGTPGLVQFTRPYFPISQILEARKLIIHANQNGGFNNCKTCPFLKKRIWTPRKYLFDRICIAHFTSCNLACGYCHATAEKKQQAPFSSVIPLKPTFEWLIENEYLSPKSVVMWGGGEPTINKEFENLLAFLADHGAISQVYTNGTILSDVLLKNMRSNKASIMISLGAGTKTTYKIIKGKNLFDQVIHNIEKYAEANNFNIILKMILCRENKNEVDAFLNIAQQNNVRIVCYDILMYQNRVDQEIVDAAAFLRHESMRRGIEARIGEVGAIYNPADNVEQKIEQAFNKLSLSDSRLGP